MGPFSSSTPRAASSAHAASASSTQTVSWNREPDCRSATTPGSMVWDRDNLRGHMTIGDIVPAVREAVGEARAAGAQLIVVAIHSGLSEPATFDTVTTGLPSDNVAARVAREVAGIDVIAYGHSHKEMPDTTINGVLLMQAKNWAQSVAVANLRLVRDASGWRVASKSSRLVRTAGHAESPAVLE